MSNYNRYVPDLSAFDQFGGDSSSTALDVKFRLMRRNFELISKALNQIQVPSPSPLVQHSVTPTPVALEEENYFTRIWVIDAAELVPSDDIYATTGLKVGPTGSLVINGELKII